MLRAFTPRLIATRWVNDMTLLESMQSLDYSQALESQTEAQAWLSSHEHCFGQFIDGQWLQTDTADSFDTTEAGTGHMLASLQIASHEQVDMV